MRTVFRATDEPVSTRFDYWHDVLGRTLGPLDLRRPADPDFRDRLAVSSLGPVGLADLTIAQPGVAARGHRHARQADRDLVKLDVAAAGPALIEHGDRQVLLRPGDLTLVGTASPFRLAAGPARVLSLVFPRGLLALPPDRARELAGVRLPGDRGAGALVSVLARRLADEAGHLDASAAARVGTTVLDLVTTAVAARLDERSTVPPETRRRALVAQVRAYIEANLGDPALTPATVAAAVPVSVRYLHKLFEAEQTTVAGWIRRRRLERCRDDLLDPATLHEPVGAVGARWGFADPAHFSRAFRAAYGLPPDRFRREMTTRGP